LAFAACACLVGLGLFRSTLVQHMGIIAIVLGALGMRAAAMDMYRFVRRPTERMFWLYVHLEKFITSYIAIWTAFSAVTLSRLFPQAGLAIWLWPAAFGVPAIAATVSYYKQKYAALASFASPWPTLSRPPCDYP
jgi:uncharacterized membrane-anchored protein